jgi:hypothetical protein
MCAASHGTNLAALSGEIFHRITAAGTLRFANASKTNRKKKRKRITEGTRVGGRRDDTEHSLIIPVACGHVGSCFLFLIHYVRSATLVLRPIHIRWLLLPSPVFKCN